ncbi:hypothetical protein BZARG_2991 [Bizionia argentinensis JUB59]|uniref:STAS/SEC14 domain-containing protein n=1 Tax=Bizionia argentinensis JUB59 TaxID=1046627 RepID=G2EFK0_9FLAO|nr:hypothetical protein [Bizionia argentinensis]EGV42788.1 hypothetical protein BZARG_2991 [Bizionia argentinensis JUB59]
MKFENSIYFKQLKHHKVVFPFATYYLCDRFLIAEHNEEVHFDWDKIQQTSEFLIEFYGPNCKIGHIANRVNNYSIDPNLWRKFNKEYGFIIASAIAVYDDFAYRNATLEKQFSSNSIKRCTSLEEAIFWMQNLDEFK